MTCSMRIYLYLTCLALGWHFPSGMHLTITIKPKYKALLLCKPIPFPVHRNVYFSAQLWCSAFSLLYQLSLLCNWKRGAVSSMKCWDYLEWKSQHWFFSNLIKIELEKSWENKPLWCDEKGQWIRKQKILIIAKT